ncbi:MAG: hypothetical protein ACYS9X_22850 [Planctomycetota bacterium]
MSRDDAASGGEAGRPSLVRPVLMTMVRVAVGLHFAGEGIARLAVDGWSTAAYVDAPGWIFAPIFRWAAASPGLLAFVDFISTWLALLVGIALVLGCLTRLAGAVGIALFLIFYVAHPPFVGIALFMVLVFPTGVFFGLDRFLLKVAPAWLARIAIGGGGAPAPATSAPVSDESPGGLPGPVRPARREALAALAGVPFLGTFVVAALKGAGWRSHEEERLRELQELQDLREFKELKEREELAAKELAAAKPPAAPATPAEPKPAPETDAKTGATIKKFDFVGLDRLKGPVPHAEINGVDFSRLILGGNLVGGWAHARDLIYVSKLVKAYHHKWKVFETFQLAEKCGVNAFLTNPALCGIISEYWKRGLGKIKFISDCGGRDVMTATKKSIDTGAAACYVQGQTADNLARQGKFDTIGNVLALTWQNGLPAGIGAHSIDTVKGCVKAGLEPDFWMKTLHHHNYWSAKPKQRHDNVWCYDPAETIAYMRTLEQPWIAFKCLAAGAIDPRDGFPYAFANGADFICVGMYDFQLVEDVNLASWVLKKGVKRQRPWRA